KKILFIRERLVVAIRVSNSRVDAEGHGRILVNDLRAPVVYAEAEVFVNLQTAVDRKVWRGQGKKGATPLPLYSKEEGTLLGISIVERVPGETENHRTDQ